MPTPTGLEARVAALETLNRRLVAAVLGLGVLLFALLALALVVRAEASADCERPGEAPAVTATAPPASPAAA